MKIILFPQPKSDNIPGFPAVKRRPGRALNDLEVDWIVHGGRRQRTGYDGLTLPPEDRSAMSTDAARNWLAGAHAKGEITDAQLEMFWPGDAR